jgi:hypothetical protein
MSQQTGKATVTAAGKRLATKGGAKLGYGNPERTAVLGDQGVLGYTEAPTVPYVDCTIQHSTAVSLREIANMRDVVIVFETDTKKSYVLRNAWSAKALELDKGDVAVRFEAMSCEEV